MESDDTIVIAILYGGSWFKKDDGSWNFKDYESEITEVPQNCTLDQLKDEVYNIVNMDRDTYSLKMKFKYVISYDPCAPQEIRRDRDVRIFLRLVKEMVPKTPLYVEILPRADVDPINQARCRPLISDSGSNQYSSRRLLSPIERRMKGKEKLNASHVVITPEVDDQLQQNIQLSKNPIRENYAWEKQMPESQWSKTQFPNATSNFQSGSSESSFSDDDDFHYGQVYDDKKGLKEKLYLYALTNNFQFRVVRSSTTRYEVRCFHESCRWRLRANKIPHSEKLFKIKSFFRQHSCKNLPQPMDRNHRQVNSRIRREVIKKVSQEVQNMDVCPPDIRRRSVGRPMKNKILSEEKMKYKCGRCGNIGHNRVRCIEPIIRNDIGGNEGES